MNDNMTTWLMHPQLLAQLKGSRLNRHVHGLKGTYKHCCRIFTSIQNARRLCYTDYRSYATCRLSYLIWSTALIHHCLLSIRHVYTPTDE